jgi:hypothetical protein
MADKNDKILDPITGELVDPRGHLNQEVGDPYELKKDFAELADARGDEMGEEPQEEESLDGMSPVEE